MLCTLVTLYFADEIPLTVSQHHLLSDSAPLLDDEQQNGFEFSKSKPAIPVMDDINGKTTEDHFERNVNIKNENLRAGEHDENVMDGPGAVLVNFLTSLRHLPPAMNSVLIVMALTWVCSICAYFQSILIASYFLCFLELFLGLILLVEILLILIKNDIFLRRCHGSPSFCLIRTGWEEKFSMGILRGTPLK